MPRWVRHSSVGFELVGAVLGFALLGVWIDRRYGSQPWGLLIGVVLGMVGGFYNLIRQALLAAREAQVDDAADAAERLGSDGARERDED